MILVPLAFIASFVTFLVGMTVYYYNRKEPANRCLFACSVVLSLCGLSVGMNGVVANSRIAYAWTNYLIVMVHLLPPVFVHLCLAISKIKRFMRPRWIFLLYLPSIIMVLWLVLRYGMLVRGVGRSPFGFYPEFETKRFILSWLYVGGGFVGGLWVLAKSTKERSVFYGFWGSIGLGMIMAFPLYIILQRSLPKALPILFYMIPLCLLPFSGTVVYAMFRPDGFVNVRLREILMDLILNATTYLCLIFVASALFFWMVWFVERMWSPFNPAMVNLAALFVVVPISIILKPRIYDLIYRVLSTPKKYIWRERFTTFCLELKRASTTKGVMDLMRERLPKLIDTDIYYLFLYDNEREDFVVVDTNLEEGKGKTLGIGQGSPLIQRINIGSTLKALSRLEDDPAFGEEISLFRRYGIELCLPIKGGVKGMVCFGKKKGPLGYDREEREEISRLVYLDAFDYIQDFLHGLMKPPPYILTFYIKGIEEDMVLKKDEGALDYMLRPDATRIRITREGMVLTEDLALSNEKRIVFAYIAYKAWVNDVYERYGDWRSVPADLRCFSEEIVSNESLVAKRLMEHHRYLPQASRVRQWISEIREELKAIGAEDLIPKTPFGMKAKGYTINGKIILEREVS